MTTITWSAGNNSSYLVGQRRAATKRGGIRAARAYIRGELYGEGRAIIYDDGEAVAETERSLHTGYEWVTREI